MGHKAWKASALERGQGLVEYAMILVLVAVVAIVVISSFGKTVKKQYCKALYSIDANASIPSCEAIDVSCTIQSTNPFQMEAGVTDNAGESNITQVQFFVDGSLYNTELRPRYCLQSGDSACEYFRGSAGSHTIRAVAFNSDGNVGECTITATTP